MGLFDKLFGTRSQREIKRIQPMVDKVLDLEAEYKELSDEALKAKTGEGGRIFGSITSKQIADELQKQHKHKIDKRKIELEDAIRSLGYTKVPVKLHHEVTATLNVHVKEQ